MTICCTQAEVDAAAQRGDLIEIDDTWRGSSSAVLWENASAVLWENASAVLSGNARAVLRGNARAVLWGNARAVLWGNASAVLWGNASAVLSGNARADLSENASAVLRGNASAVLSGNARADLREDARAVLSGNARADLREDARAVLWGNASAVLSGNARADLREDARADLSGNASADLRENASAVLRGWLTTARLIGPDATATGNGRALRVADPAAWAKYQGLAVRRASVVLYKAVDEAGTGGRGHGVVYAVGASVTATDWDPSHRECGGGLHLCATPEMARRHGKDVARVLACEVALDDIAVFEPNLDKVRCRSVRVVGEVTE